MCVQAKVEDRSQLRIRWCITARLPLDPGVLSHALAQSYTNEYRLTGNVSEGELVGEATKLDEINFFR